MADVEENERDVDVERERVERQLEQQLEQDAAEQEKLDLGTDLDEEQQHEAEKAPNTVFVPLAVTPPQINRREFAVYLVLLCCFTYNIRAQHLDLDYRDRLGVESRLSIAQWHKIQNIDEYVAWFPNLVNALGYWQDNQYTAIEHGVASMGHESWKPWSLDSGAQTPAVLLGTPVFTQVRCPPAARGETSCRLEPSDRFADVKFDSFKRMTQRPTQGFSNADGSACRWDPGPDAACYAHTRFHNGAYEFHLGHNATHGILSGTVDWTPNLWVDSYTVELGHYFTIFIPSERRFIVSSLKVHVDPSGGVTLGTLDIQAYEPFIRGLGDEKSWPIEFMLELAFYVIICLLFVQELSDIVDCIFHSEMLVPLQIVTRSLRLSLLEVHYFHEQSAEVYDPRDPSTGEAFVFPDKDDLSSHIETSVAPTKRKIHQLEAKLRAMKLNVAQAPPMPHTSSEYKAFHHQMRAIHVDLIAAELEMLDEVFVGEMATMLQLAAMWCNHWSQDFEPGYLATLAGHTSRRLQHHKGITSKKAPARIQKFEDVDWVAVARSYIAWTRSLHGTPGKENASIVFHREPISRVFVERLAHEDTDPQHRIFYQLERHVNHLDVIRNLIVLHDRMMIAYNIQYWDGPRGVDRPNTIERAYQDGMHHYNRTGSGMLTQMAKFPHDVQKGFASPDANKADTIRTMGQAVSEELMDLLNIAGLLGFFFPGSPMWETRRCLRAAGLYKQSDGFFESFQNIHWGMVSATSMGMYMKQTTDSRTSDSKNQVHMSNPLHAVTTTEADEQDGPPASSPTFLRDSVMTQQHGSLRATKSALDMTMMTKEKLSGMSYNARHRTIEKARTAAIGNVAPGVPGWRRLVHGPISTRINYDGQFMTVQTEAIGRSFKNKVLSASRIYPLWLWVKTGLKTYLYDLWNGMEMILYVTCMAACYCKLQMYFGEADDLEAHCNRFLEQMVGANRTYPLPLKTHSQDFDLTQDAIQQGMLRFSRYNAYYMWTLVPTSLIMWIKLFKYFDVIPQMGLLTKIIAASGRPIMVFGIMSAMPCMGLALSYHVAYGQVLFNYSTIGKSFNSVLLVSLGLFDFQEIYSLAPVTAMSLFWITAILIVFTLVNIFVAIILNSYEEVVRENPDANDSSQFFTVALMQAKRTCLGALSRHSNEQHPDLPDSTKPTILAEKMSGSMGPIEKDAYWDVFDSYFSLAGADGGTDKPSVNATTKPNAPATLKRATSRFKMLSVDDSRQTVVKKDKQSRRQPRAGDRGDLVAHQVGALSTQFEKLSKAHHSIEKKVDALQAQQATIIKMLKKIT